MKVIVFGANGQTGIHIVKEALERGHEVTAFVRKPDSLTLSHERLLVRGGDGLNATEVAAAIQGQEAVISALGPGGPGVSDQYLNILTEGIPHLIAGMQAAGLRRIVVMGSIATLQIAPGVLRRDAPDFPAFARNISGAHLQAAEALAASGLSWTIVCPPLKIEAGERTGVYRVQADFLIPGEGRITYEDMAHFILDELQQGKYLYHRVNIAY